MKEINDSFQAVFVTHMQAYDFNHHIENIMDNSDCLYYGQHQA